MYEPRQACAVLHFAPVCSSWVWINRSSSGRSVDCPLGDVSQRYVSDANCMVSRVVFLALLATCLNLRFLIEQPASSIMNHHPKFKHMMLLAERGVLSINTTHTWFGMFGGTSPKPTRLWGTPTWVQSLHRTLDKSKSWEVVTADHYIDQAGRKRVVGTKSLKSTQAYPPGYGEEVARLWEQDDHMAVLDLEDGKVKPVCLATGRLALKSVPWDVEAWEDLNVDAVLVVLRGAALRPRCPLQGRLLLA